CAEPPGRVYRRRCEQAGRARGSAVASGERIGQAAGRQGAGQGRQQARCCQSGQGAEVGRCQGDQERDLAISSTRATASPAPTILLLPAVRLPIGGLFISKDESALFAL